MNFYDVLAAKNWDGGIPTINFFDLLFAQSMGGAERWETYEGTLPATLYANGDDMRQYQVYGATGGVGDDSGTAYGYEVDISTSDGTNVTTTPIYIGDTALQKDEYIDYEAQKVYRRTAQLIDAYRRGTTSSTIGNTRVTSIHYILATGSKISAKLYDTTQGLRFAFVGFNEAGAAEWDATQTAAASKRTYDSGYQTAPFECTDNASYMYVVIVSYTDNRVIAPEDVYGKIGIVYGSIEDIPPTYTPYLQPTDPPVTLPALPTCKGTTIVDYAGSGTAPEKVYFEYQGGKQP